MMRKILLAFISIHFLVLGGLTTAVMSEDVPRMTKDELKAMLGSPDLVIVDVRTFGEYMSSDFKIKGAVRAGGGAFEDFLFSYPKGKIFVLYCTSPNEERSAKVAQGMIERGRIRNEFTGYTNIHVLKGGWEEWLKANYPTEKR